MVRKIEKKVLAERHDNDLTNSRSLRQRKSVNYNENRSCAKKVITHSHYGLESEAEDVDDPKPKVSKKVNHQVPKHKKKDIIDKENFLESEEEYVDNGISSDSGESVNFFVSSEDDDFEVSAKPSKKVTPMRLKKKALDKWQVAGKTPPIKEFKIKIKLTSNKEYKVMRADYEKEVTLMEKREKHPLMNVYPRLHTSFEPDTLLMRDKEIKNITSFITTAISPKSTSNNRSIYISGVPGTGKTASVMKAINALLKTKKFTFVYVNGLELVQPGAIFGELYKGMYPTSRKTSTKTAREKLSKIFCTNDSKRLPVVLVVDELDMILNQKQDIIYDIFDWAANEASKFTVLAIANTLDLPERTLKQRVSSRLGFNREIFEPYGFAEIEKILQHRITKNYMKYFDTGFIGLISRKVAAISGDLRKAFEMVRRGIEIAIENGDTKLNSKHAQIVWKETQQSIPVVFVKSLSLHQELFLRSILQEVRSTGFEEVQFTFVYRNYYCHCLSRSEDPLEMVDGYVIVASLERCGFIEIKGSDHINNKLILNNTVDEIDTWLKTTTISEE